MEVQVLSTAPMPMKDKVCKHCKHFSCGCGIDYGKSQGYKLKDRFDTCDRWEERPEDLTVEQIVSSNPNEIKWIEGDLPDPKTVPKDSRALVWLVDDVDGELKRITVVSPRGDKLNPIRWGDGFPIGYQEKVKFYAWLVRPKTEGNNPKE